MMQPYLYTWWQLSQKVKRWLVQLIHTLKHSDIWKRSFGDLHVTSRSSVNNKLQKLVEHYYSQVYVKVHRKSEKHKNNVKSIGKSSSQLNKSWRTMPLPRTSKYHPVRYSYV